MMTACDLSAITKPWEVQSKVRMAGILTQVPYPGHSGSAFGTSWQGDLMCRYHMPARPHS